MPYTDSPLCKALAVSCACCGRPLVDSISVETGVGPDCRKNFGYDEAQRPADWAKAREIAGEHLPVMALAAWGEDAHKASNVMAHRIAVEQTGASVRKLTAALAALGYVRMAARIAKRIGAVRVVRDGESFKVFAPFSEDFRLSLWRRVPERRGMREQIPGKRAVFYWSVPVNARERLWQAIMESFPGSMIVGATVSTVGE